MEAERELDDLYFDLWDNTYDKTVVVTSDDTDDDDTFYDVAVRRDSSYRRIDDL
ncbi:MAG: hypothetical protein RIF36_23720 [Imperialibacter sp.]|uniref:hypothetical protein n=1 Tax=Imperialibacter sp. TaxID=2038411 RepID=UPI0032EF41F2